MQYYKTTRGPSRPRLNNTKFPYPENICNDIQRLYGHEFMHPELVEDAMDEFMYSDENDYRYPYVDILKYYYKDKATYAQIAAGYDISSTTVGNIIHKCLDKVHEFMYDAGFLQDIMTKGINE